jgi:gliding motility-associated-like protein
MKLIVSIFSLFLVTINLFAQVNLTSGLQLYLPFNGNVNDASGNGNNATINGPILTTDQYGNANSAYQFDGINDFMEIKHHNSIALKQSMSLVAKVYVSDFYSGLCEGNVIFQKGNTDIMLGWYSMRFSCGPYNGGCTPFRPNFQNFYAHVQNNNSNFPFGTSPGKAGAPPYILVNKWYCVVTTWDADTIKVFVDGVLTLKWKNTFTPGTNNHNLFIGKLNNPSFPYNFNGKLDELRIYDRAINLQEINALCSNCNDSALTVNGNSTICVGDSTKLKVIGGSNNTWLPNSFIITNNDNTAIAYPTNTTIYTITSADANSNCIKTTSITIQVNTSLPLIISKSNDIDCNNSSSLLQVSGANSYSWYPSTFLNNAKSENPIVSPRQTTTYFVIGTNGTCDGKDSIEVKVLKNGIVKLIIPTAFSPNGDGRNDCFEIKTKNGLLIYHLKIYNRWGALIWETKDINECWNGNYNSGKGEMGVYFYNIIAKSDCGEIFEKGDVILVR